MPLCPHCSSENPDGMRFCGQCGGSMSIVCGQCEFENPAGFRFCGQCGATLESKPPDPPLEAISGPDAERRQMTVVFADLVGSTQLSDTLDPEDFREILKHYQSLCAEVVRRYDGHVAQHLGDGILIYFGYPKAHEDDARRAALASLDILQGIERWNRELEKERDLVVGVRLGLHTGPVVAGEIGEGPSQEQLALGQTPNLAARLQGIASPGSAVMSAQTQELVRELIEVEPLGRFELRGLKEDVEVFRILRDTGFTNRLEANSGGELTPWIGRRSELGVLVKGFHRAQQGAGNAIQIVAEAGMGKSRLIYRFREQLRDEDPYWWISRCSTYHQSSAFFPLIQSIEKLFQIDRAAGPQLQQESLRAGLEALGMSAEASIPWIGHLLGLEVDGFPLPALPPAQLKQQTFDILISLWLHQAEQQATVFVFEDFHWVDPSTRELVKSFIERSKTSKAQVIVTTRPDPEDPWPSKLCFQISLNRLSEPEAVAMVQHQAGQRQLQDHVVREIVERADGVPLFIEELTKSLLESDFFRADGERLVLHTGVQPAIPVTLQDSLMSRLDHLGNLRSLAQLASVLGRHFSLDLLQAVSGLSEQALTRGLDELVRADLLRCDKATQPARYWFKHALIQETAYGSLLRASRRDHHRKVAEILEAEPEPKVWGGPEILAHHFTEARMGEKAIPLWQQAAAKDLERSANMEAAMHLQKALSVVDQVADPDRRADTELALLTALGPAYMATRGFASIEVEQVYARARELCRDRRGDGRLFPVLLGLFRYYGVRADWSACRELSEQLLAHAEQEGRTEHIVEARRALGGVFFHLGDFAEAQRHLEIGFDVYSNQDQSGSTVNYALHPGVNCLIYRSLCQGFIGDLAEARKTIDQAIQLSRGFKHYPTLAFALGIAASIEQLGGDVVAAKAQAEEGAEVSEQHSLFTMAAYCRIFRGWARAMQGDPKGGKTEMEAAIEAWGAQGAGASVTYFLGLLAEAHDLDGDSEAALRTLEQALDRVRSNGERFFESELHRLRGDYLSANGSESESQVHLERALNVARRQGSRIFALRSSIRLAKLWIAEGRRQEALDLVSENRDRAEGLALADLEEAEALLQAG